MGTATWQVLSKPRSPFRGHRRARGALSSPLSADQCSPSGLACPSRSSAAVGQAAPGLGPRPWRRHSPWRPGLQKSCQVPSVWSSLQIQPGPLLAVPQEPWGQAGKAARVSAAEPSWDRGPGRAHSPQPGVEGAEGQGAPRGEAGRVCSPPPRKGRGWAGGTVPHPERNGRGGQGAQPCQVASICPGPTGMHLRLMESNNASTGDSHWLLRAFNPASLSSQGFMR